MAQKILLIREDLFPPFDEGMKLFTLRVQQELEKLGHVRVLHDDPASSPRMNRLLLAPRAIGVARSFRPDRIIYIPAASITFNSFIRARMVRAMISCPLVLVGLQKRQYAPWQSGVIRRIAPERLFVLSRAMAQSLEPMGLNARVLPAGVDREAFAPAPEKRKSLREKYGLPQDRRILLHVGHIREGRNIRWLLEIQKLQPEAQVLLVGSTTTKVDDALRAELERAGVTVLHHYLPAIEELYQLSDCYVFPVQAADAAMEVPLSVLEAMAVNLPVVTTRFGRLPELFGADQDFHYADTPQEMNDALHKVEEAASLRLIPGNREKTEPFDWNQTARALLEA